MCNKMDVQLLKYVNSVQALTYKMVISGCFSGFPEPEVAGSGEKC